MARKRRLTKSQLEARVAELEAKRAVRGLVYVVARAGFDSLLAHLDKKAEEPRALPVDTAAPLPVPSWPGYQAVIEANRQASEQLVERLRRATDTTSSASSSGVPSASGAGPRDRYNKSGPS